MSADRAGRAPPGAASPALRHDAQLQFAQLRQPGNCPSGIYLSPALAPPADATRLHGVVFVRRGPYAGAVFRFDIAWTQQARAPDVRFADECVHPLVDPQTHLLRLQPRFAVWRPREDLLPALLAYIKAIFKRRTLDVLDAASAADAELFRLYGSDRALFMRLAAQSAASSVSPARLYAADSKARAGSAPAPAGIRFGELDDELYAQVRAAMLGK